jgi:complement component 1 Q subcomponent-binding protein
MYIVFNLFPFVSVFFLSDLDETLQRAFQDLLKARGLSAKVATYVMDYLSLKEHREYMRWLHNVETFFASP